MTLPAVVLITGASGNLGAKLAAHLAGQTRLVLIDRQPRDGVHTADLSRWGDWIKHFQGVEAVVHLAGDPVAYHDWPDLLGPNVDAMLNVYEAAALHGVRRFVFASSNHVMGGYQDGPPLPITEDLPPKPGLRYTADGAERFSGPYAAAKLFGERVGQHYAAVRGLEVIAVRLGWVWRGINRPDQLPADRGEWFRQLWLSDRDFLHLMECCLTAPLPERFLIVNGMSANSGMRWDLTVARTQLGYRPQDDVHRPA
ncbi:MAG: NAD(P)-dependent oxidoreductase [Gemmataceae bacterium]|uniref:NAD(P)-dependent oxidoreductase n=1 Tax=Thermogemmata fonticola TaxID=2755323 RepID=A0A7V8VGL0_9BACT|nr:NAD(P)-dependent oxidoreductase [Thermogemmata fonticola]MBA2227537.1 NAD(P)-dependent oxidoreductase [Thermogemmata fonticola]MCX8138716.1 NAD(P)-dependent oxidoreductase [Gemmataceae bacterium]